MGFVLTADQRVINVLSGLRFLRLKCYTAKDRGWGLVVVTVKQYSTSKIRLTLKKMPMGRITLIIVTVLK